MPTLKQMIIDSEDEVEKREDDYEDVKELTNPRSDKFDIHAAEVLYREKMERTLRIQKNQKELTAIKQKVDKELGVETEEKHSYMLDRMQHFSKESFLPKDVLDSYKKRFYEIRDRQNEIMDAIVEQKFDTLFMKGSLVEEYKNLEKLKLTLVDTIQNSFRKDEPDPIWHSTFTHGQ